MQLNTQIAIRKASFCFFSPDTLSQKLKTFFFFFLSSSFVETCASAGLHEYTNVRCNIHQIGPSA